MTTPTDINDYDSFIVAKNRRAVNVGFDPMPITGPLFPFQKHVVEWAIKKGRAAMFEECGLGKTLQQLEWASQVASHTNGVVLVLTPLAVASQTLAEAQRFGIAARIVRHAEDVALGINITNYEKLDLFDGIEFAGVVLDESSILKNFTGKTRIKLTERFKSTPYRLCCTATPSPNDYAEFGQHADFLGICTPGQMLATFFINDTFNTGDWRLKKHAEGEFWEWVASWASCVGRPSDIGFDDAGYILPSLNLKTITVDVDESAGEGSEELFKHATLSATTMHKELRETADARADAVAEMVNASSESWIVWCNTNVEADALVARIPDAVEVRGSHSSEYKEAAVKWFIGSPLTTKELILIGKSSKLSACGNRSILRTESESINPKSRSEKSGNLKEELQSRTGDTCGTTISPILTSYPKELQSNSRNTIGCEGKSISSALKPEIRQNLKPKSGSVKTQTNGNRNALKSSEYLSNNFQSCMQDAAERAKSADSKTTETNHFSLSLTIATLPEKSVDCCAQSAISESGNLMTTSRECGGQSHTSSRRVLISKCSIFGYGLNLQHCRNVAFVGLSYSFEDFYQALRRSYRFGQEREVNAYIVQARTEGAILATVKRKMEQHQQMQERMKMASIAFKNSTMKTTPMKTDINTVVGDGWQMHHGDCVRVARQIQDESIDFSVFSPPFADLFTYSNDPQDMGNCIDLDEFRGHFEILIAEMMRIMKPGRIVAVHCVELLATKWKDGHGGGKDFPGEIIRMFWRHGFIQHSPRITIWKSPVTEMQRTKAHGLLYKTLKADSCDSRVGCADYLLIFKKPGENPNPVTKDPNKYPVDWWQEVASPVWMTVDQGRVLNKDGARDQADERHICPLQLDVIDRAVELWSNEGDLVYSPFTGIGSEGVGALTLNRCFVGSELKESYFNQAVQNLQNAKSQLTLF
jgi:DNA modification methylase